MMLTSIPTSSERLSDEVGIEVNIIDHSGAVIPVLVNIQPRFRDGELESMLVSLMDIEQRVKTEQQILASIQEKDALLKEIHHRVKNNLQIVSSLLNLQSNQIKDEKSIEAFRESQNRIRSMALIHEKLYRSDNLANIKFDEYINDLGFFLLRAYNDDNRRVRLDVQIDSIALDIDSAIPCGLIVNELISNSLKHGFKPSSPHYSDGAGYIQVRLSQLPKDQIQLVIADNGVGFPPGFDLYKTGSLGLQLVNSLTRQLGGEVTFTNQEGARIEIVFSLRQFTEGLK